MRGRVGAAAVQAKRLRMLQQWHTVTATILAQSLPCSPQKARNAADVGFDRKLGSVGVFGICGCFEVKC